MDSAGIPAPVERLLIRLPNWVGDIVMALPAVQALRRHLPAARFVAMARTGHEELASRIAGFDEVAPNGCRRRCCWRRRSRAR